MHRIIELMRIEELTRLFKRQPFRPFTIHMSDGSSYTVTHPDQVILTPRTTPWSSATWDTSLVWAPSPSAHESDASNRPTDLLGLLTL